MDLWGEVTDPQWQKKANNGRFNFTTIDPHYQLRKATEMWGPYGEEWGIKNTTWSTMGDPPILMLEATFWYPNFADKAKSVEFDYAIDMKWQPGMDMTMRAMTRFRSKCLSLLGFNSDVYMGRFDDPAYVKAAEARYGDQEKILAQTLAAIRTAASADALNNIMDRIKIAVAGDTIPEDSAASMFHEIELRRSKLES